MLACLAHVVPTSAPNQMGPTMVIEVRKGERKEETVCEWRKEEREEREGNTNNVKVAKYLSLCMRKWQPFYVPVSKHTT